MDLFKTIQELLEEKRKVNSVIAHLESLLHGNPDSPMPLPRRRRGRKGMNEHERAQVSLRMKTYWEKRRKTG